MDQQTKDQIRNLIAQSKLEKALAAFTTWAATHGDNELKNTLFLKNGELNALKKDINLGFLTNGEENIRRNKLAAQVLGLMDGAEDESTSNTSNPPPNPPPNPPVQQQTTPQSPVFAALKTILFMGANPPGTQKVQLEIEHSRISTELKNKFNLEVAKFVSASEIPKLITSKKPNIIHFSGHGKDPESGEHGADDNTRLIALPDDYSKKGGIVVFDNDMRKMKILEDNQLEYMFKTVINNFKIPIEVAVFNSCYSESQAKVLGKYIPYVIGSALAIKDDIAIAFAVGFYYGIADGQSIENSFLQGKMQAVFEDATAESLIVLYKNGELQAM